MQYETTKATKLTIRDDKATSIASSTHGANIDAVGFNMTFIARRRPHLAVEIMRLHRDACDLTVETPVAPDEDHLIADEELRRLAQR